MRIDVVTLFPKIFREPLNAGLLGKACESKLLDIHIWNLRDFTDDPHRTVDDAPFGGGAGMIMKCEPIFSAVESLKGQNSLKRIILMSPRGRLLKQYMLKDLAQEWIVLLSVAGMAA